MLFRHPIKKRQVIPKNRIQVNQSNPLLLIPVIYVVTDHFDHNGAFWGIRFPVHAFSFYQSVVDVIQEYLEGDRYTLLKPQLQGLDLAAVLSPVIVERDRKFVEHKVVIILGVP
jgi:hypothetical protein